MTEPSSRQPGSRNVAVVGCGYWGKNLVRNFAELGALSAIVDDNRESARSLADQHKVREASLDDVLSDPSIEGIAIATPAATHHAIAERAMRADKHVFVEKPLALDIAHAQALCALAEQRGLCLMVGHLLQYHPAFVKLRDLVRDGRLGRLQYLYSNRLNFGLIRREEDVLWSFAPHDISMVLSLVGSEPEFVEATGSYQLHPRIADFTTTHLRFPGGERAHIFVSWLHPVKEQRLVVVGDAAMAVFDDGETWERKLQIFAHRTQWSNGVPRAVKADAEAVTLQVAEPLRVECNQFLECIRTGVPAPTDGREGLRVLSVLTRASEALERGLEDAPRRAELTLPGKTNP